MVVLSKHRVTELRVEGGRCRAERVKDIDRVEQRGGRVRACAGARCAEAAALDLDCTGLPQLRIPGVGVRSYGGRFRLSARDGALRVVARVPVEDYVAGVVEAELAGAPPAAADAQAVLARSFAFAALREPRHDDAPLCDLTHCQVFAGRAQHTAPGAAAARTRGQVMVDEAGRLSPVFFHSTCGGHTQPARDAWPELTTERLVAVADLDDRGRPWCRGSAHARWVYEVEASTLGSGLAALAGRALDAESLELTPAGGPRWRIADRRGEAFASATAIHAALGRHLGWSAVKSSRFTAERLGRRFVLRGAGLGHGVGLCQTGAIARARAGQDASAILRAYFPGLELGSLDEVR